LEKAVTMAPSGPTSMRFKNLSGTIQGSFGPLVRRIAAALNFVRSSLDRSFFRFFFPLADALISFFERAVVGL
jgi:hypothetical protein